MLVANRASANSKDNSGRPALQCAARYNHIEVVSLLLQAHARIDDCDGHGETALTAASANGYVDVVQLLLAEGGNPNSADLDGDTPVLAAARMGHLHIVQLLVTSSAAVNYAYKQGFSALWFAALNGHCDIVDLLLKSHADANIAINSAEANGNNEIVRCIQDAMEKITGAVATDGSSIDAVAAWSVYFPFLQAGFATGVSGEHQTSFRAEVEAIYNVLLCLSRMWDAGFRLPVSLVIVTDCTAAVSMIHSYHGVAPLLSRRIRSLLTLCEQRGVHVSFQWVPSHGRHVASWRPEHFSEFDLRQWNAIADQLARDAAKRRLSGSDREACAAARRHAYFWEMETLAAVANIATANLNSEAA
eukprot:s2744_g7.t1